MPRKLHLWSSKSKRWSKSSEPKGEEKDPILKKSPSFKNSFQISKTKYKSKEVEKTPLVSKLLQWNLKSRLCKLEVLAKMLKKLTQWRAKYKKCRSNSGHKGAVKALIRRES